MIDFVQIGAVVLSREYVGPVAAHPARLVEAEQRGVDPDARALLVDPVGSERTDTLSARYLQPMCH